MNEQSRKRRDWIKNALIVFLIIMLLLTFFSNSIMNYSLPEVSAQYVTSGTIQAKVRGSGVVKAGDPYAVSIEETRTISSVAVKNGDQVTKGDVLVYLEEGDSTELEEAQKALDKMVDAYEQALLAAEVDISTTNNVTSGNLTSYNTYKAQVEALKKEIQSIQDEITIYETEIAKVQRELDEAEYTTTDTSKEKAAYDAAKTARVSAESAYNTAVNEAKKYNASVTDSAKAQTASNEAAAAISAKETEISNHKISAEYVEAESKKAGLELAVKNAQTALQNAIAGVGASNSGSTEPSDQNGEAGEDDGDTTETQAAANTETNEDAIAAAQENLNAAVEALNRFNEEQNASSGVYGKLAQMEAELAELQAAKTAYDSVVTAYSTYKSAQSAEAAAKTAYENAGSDHSVAISQYKSVISKNQKYVDELKEKKTAKESDLTDLLSQMSQESNLSQQKKDIADQRELIAKLTEKNVGSAVVAPVSGKVQNLSLTAGEKINAGVEFATILPEGKGFTMEVTVTKDQAQRLSVGDVADIQNSWYYSNVTAVLTQIKTSSSDPANSKILVFTVEGDVNDGQSLSISIGQKSANYDTIVPNSAIREDSNGKFILIVSQKSSPLGNRYYAERVDVEVLGSDDTQTAVSGALNGWEFVITTSTKPVEAGQLIRLAD